METYGLDLDTRTQEILLASSNHDLTALKPFLRVPGAATVQDPETGSTPLHAAIAACGSISDAKEPDYTPHASTTAANNTTNGHISETVVEDKTSDIEKAMETVKELFLSGAIWNDLDTNNDTPGCLAWRLGQKDLYELCVAAGVRAELLMNLMGGYEQLPDDDEDDKEEETMDGEEPIDSTILSQMGATSGPAQSSTALPAIPSQIAPDVNSRDYLSSNLRFSDTKLLDGDANGVMMVWESNIMARTVALLAPTQGLRILNIGFGMGIVDRLFTATQPVAHHIIEAHPAILSALKAPGSEFGSEWASRNSGKNVVHVGRWQDVVPRLLEKGELFDVIYFDTFGENYGQLKMFFAEYVVGLLSEEGRFGFFNGLGADRKVCYDVYCRVAELDLCDAGFDTEWHDVAVEELGNEGEGQWEGVKRRYWTLETYRLPVCTFMG